MINVVLYQPEISPNTGNIIRTCFSIGAKLHIIKPTSFDIEPKYLKRPAAGILLSDIEHEVHESYNEFQKIHSKHPIFYITRYGQNNYSDVDFSQYQNKDVFIMFGRESTGIPKEILRSNLKNCLRIPMVKKARSLNLANTVVLMTYEIQRQFKFEGLSTEEFIKGKDWILK